MNKIIGLIQHVAPTLASALGGPLAGMATNMISKQFFGEDQASPDKMEALLETALSSPEKLHELKELENTFKKEMEQLNVDVFALEVDDRKSARDLAKVNQRPQIMISACFLGSYFLMLLIMFSVEVTPWFEATKGEGSIMGELQILLGVLTAGVGQILSFWFGGVMGKNSGSRQNDRVG